jgi:hypothetical protein
LQCEIDDFASVALEITDCGVDLAERDPHTISVTGRSAERYEAGIRWGGAPEGFGLVPVVSG